MKDEKKVEVLELDLLIDDFLANYVTVASNRLSSFDKISDFINNPDYPKSQDTLNTLIKAKQDLQKLQIDSKNERVKKARERYKNIYISKFEELINNNLYLNQSPNFISDLREKAKTDTELVKLALANVRNALQHNKPDGTSYQDVLVLLAREKILTKDNIPDDLQNIIVSFYTTHNPHMSWEEIRALVGNKLSPQYLRERMREELEDFSPDRVSALLKYRMEHLSEFAKVPLITNKEEFDTLVELASKNNSLKVLEQLFEYHEIELSNGTITFPLTEQQLKLKEVTASKKQNYASVISAYKNGQNTLVHVLVNQQSSNLTDVDANGNTLLHYAIANRDYKLAISIVNKSGHMLAEHSDTALCQMKNSTELTPFLYLLNQPYSAEKAELMSAIMTHPSFSYKKEKIGKSVDHLIAAIHDQETADLFLKNLKSIDNAKAEKRIRKLFNRSTEKHQAIIVDAVQHSSVNSTNHTSVFAAAAAGEYDVVTALLRNPNLDINAPNKNNLTILHQATIDGQHETLQAILSNDKLKANLFFSPNSHPIIDVLFKLHDLHIKGAPSESIEDLTKVLNLLLESPKLDINSKDKLGNTPILIVYQQLQTINLSIAKIEAANATKSSLGAAKDTIQGFFKTDTELDRLKIYKRSLDAQFKKLFDDSRTDILSRNNANETLLSIAVSSKNRELIAKIFTQFQDRPEELDRCVNQLDRNNNSPLMTACSTGDIAVIHDINDRIKDGDKENAFTQQNKDGQNALMLACISGNETAVQFALKNTSQISQTDIYKNNLLHYASKNPTILRLLLQEDKLLDGLNKRNTQGQTPLIKAIVEGNSESVKLLIASGADINLPDNTGVTPLMYACMLNRSGIITELLSKADINVNAQTKDGLTAIAYAALQPTSTKDSKTMTWKANSQTVKELIVHGADPASVSTVQNNPSLTSKLVRIVAKVTAMDMLRLLSARFLPTDSFVNNSIQLLGSKNLITETFAAAASTYQDTLKTMMVQQFKIDLNDECMIGLISFDSSKKVLSGESLKNSLNTSNQYENLDKAIFNISELRSRLESMQGTLSSEQSAKLSQYHEVLQTRYLQIRRMIDSKSVNSSTRIVLGKNLEEILEADNLILSRLNIRMNERIDGKYSETFKAFESKNMDRFIISLSENKELNKQFSKLIKAIKDGKLLVTPNVRYKLSKFEERFKALEQERKTPTFFRRILIALLGKDLGFSIGRQPDEKFNSSLTQNINSNQALFSDIIKDRTRANHTIPSNSMSQTTAFEKAVVGLSNITGVSPESIIDRIASVGGKAAGAGYAAAVAGIDLNLALKLSLMSGALSSVVGLGAQAVLTLGQLALPAIVAASPVVIAAAGVAVVTNMSASPKSDAIQPPNSARDLVEREASPAETRKFIEASSNSLLIHEKTSKEGDSRSIPSAISEALSNTYNTLGSRLKYLANTAMSTISEEVAKAKVVNRAVLRPVVEVLSNQLNI